MIHDKEKKQLIENDPKLPKMLEIPYDDMKIVPKLYNKRLKS